MKHLIIINGTMGAGKTSVCRCLQKILPDNVFLDGDWCWMMQPFAVTEETKTMVIRNIRYLLKNFLDCSQFRYVIFCWVMQEQAVLEKVLQGLGREDCKVSCFSLICTEEALRARLEKDIAAGKRDREIIGRSLERLPCYDDRMNTVKLDVSHITAEEAAVMIAERLPEGE